MRVVVVGFGLIGKERVKALTSLRADGLDLDVLAIYDPVALPENKFPDIEVSWLNDLESVSSLKPDWIIVCTPHDVATNLVERFLPLGCRILMEKPFGRNLLEATRLYQSQLFPSQLFVGFDYRFYPGIYRIIDDANKGIFGPLLSVTMALGHGGAPGMECGWKLDPQRAGGGVLLDPGIHLLDLIHLLSPTGVVPLQGIEWRGFWNTGIDEEVHLILETPNFIVNVQVSLVRWRSTFRLEVNGTEGYGLVEGRGRSYGNQTYTRGKRWGWLSGKSQLESEETVLVTDGASTFRDELTALLEPNRANATLPPCNADQALAVMRTLEACQKVVRFK